MKKKINRLYSELLWSKPLYIGVSLCVQLIALIPVAYRFVHPLLLLSLLWSYILIAKDLYTELILNKKIDKVKLGIILYLLLYCIIILINYKVNLITNIKVLIYSAPQLLILLTIKTNKGSDDKGKYLYVIRYVIYLATLIAVVSLFMSFFGKNYVYIIDNSLYLLGVSSGRLTGLYGNANILPIVSAIIIMLIIYLENYFSKIHQIILIAIHYICVFLGGSKGTLLTLLGVTLLIIITRFLSNRRNMKSSLMILAIFMISFASVISSSKYNEIIRTINLYTFYSPDSNLDDDDNIISNEIDKMSDNYRVELMKGGIDVFIRNPIFGVTVSNIGEDYGNHLPENSFFKQDNPILNNPHNTYIQILASTGILGVITIVAFGIYILRKLLLIIKYKQNCSYIYIFALITLFLISGLFESFIFFNASFIASMFYFSLGLFRLENENNKKTEGSL